MQRYVALLFAPHFLLPTPPPFLTTKNTSLLCLLRFARSQLKVLAVASPEYASMPAMQVVRSVVSEKGFLGLFDGLAAMCLRRGADWCIRFTVSSRVKEYIRSRKDDPRAPMTLPELMVSGVVGGAFSAVTHPIDCVITNSQRPGLAKTDPVSVVKMIYGEGGVKGFSRGLGVKVLDNSYHTMWMYGVGTFVYEVIGRWTRG